MKIEVEFISRELIKPSSLTPNHLRHYQLSFLDQFPSPVFLPALIFYRNYSNKNNLEICNILKHSLRQVLTIFYPLAGRIRNNSYVNCNDEGFLFVEAKANCQLSDILRHKSPSNNKNFIPVKLDDAGDLAAFAQVTFFNCGGLVISFSVSHKIADGLSEMIFGKTWAAVAKENTEINVHPFGWASLFPPTKVSVYEPTTRLILKEKIVTRIFVFDASAIQVLIAKYTENGVRPSRLVALSAFIWSRFMASTKSDEAKKTPYTVIHGVDLRSRMEPPLPKLSFGNLVWLAIADADMKAKGDDSYGIVKRMQDSIRNINVDFVKKLQNSEEHFNFLKKFADELQGKKEDFTFSNLCNFPLYKTDFGWGNPEWFGLVPEIGKNLVFLVDTKEGQGIEAWITLKEEDMVKFERDNELFAHVFSSTLHVQSRL